MSVTEERPGATMAPDAASREPPRPDSSDRWSVGLVGHGIGPSARPSTHRVLRSMAGPTLLTRAATLAAWWAVAPDSLGERDSGSVQEVTNGLGGNAEWPGPSSPHVRGGNHQRRSALRREILQNRPFQTGPRGHIVSLRSSRKEAGPSRSVVEGANCRPSLRAWPSVIVSRVQAIKNEGMYAVVHPLQPTRV